MLKQTPFKWKCSFKSKFVLKHFIYTQNILSVLTGMVQNHQPKGCDHGSVIWPIWPCLPWVDRWWVSEWNASTFWYIEQNIPYCVLFGCIHVYQVTSWMIFSVSFYLTNFWDSRVSNQFSNTVGQIRYIFLQLFPA